MLERAKAAFGWPAFAKATARQAGPDDAAHAGMPGDVVSDFPRGLPDGDIRKPLGTARWIASHEACGLLGEWKPGRFLIGRDAAGRYVGHDDDRHILTVAGSRAGKGVSLIVPNLLHWPGSCIAIDPKGELATITASRRSSVDSRFSKAMGEGGKVFVLDPFERVTGPAVDFRGAFNPLADLDADSRLRCS
jgi:type IV secretion system protein VirD4